MMRLDQPKPAPWAACAVTLALFGVACLPMDHRWSDLLRGWGAWSCPSPVQGMPGLAVDELVAAVKPFGRGEVMALLVLLVAVRDRVLAWRMAVALLITAAVVWSFKLGVGRTRPNGGQHSFVSGDTATIAITIPLAYGRWRLAAIAATIGVGMGRMLQGWHFPSDVLCGAAAGIASGLAASRIAMPRLLAGVRRWWFAAAAGTLAASLAVIGLMPGQPAFGLHFLALYGAPAALLTAWPWLSARRHLPAPPLRWTLAGAAVLLTAVAAATSLWDRDEPRNAASARDMLERGEWIVPYFNGEERLHKPILPYWGMMGSMTAGRSLGLGDDLLCRMPAVLATLATLALLAWQVRRLGRHLAWEPDRARDAGRWAAVALATFPLVIATGTASTTDAVLLVGIMGAMCVVVHALGSGITGGAALLMGLAVGWAVLGKGPLGVLVPFSALGLAWFLARRITPLRLGGLGWFALALAVGLALFLAWGIPANIRTEGRFLNAGLEHTVGRAAQARESHGGPLFYYLPVLVVGCLTWAALLPAMARALWRRELGDLPFAVVVGWIVPTFILLSLVATKLPHYLLPVFPAVAIAIGLFLVHWHSAGIDATTRRLLGWGATAMAWTLLVLGPLVAIAGWALPVAGAHAGICGVGLILAATGACVLRLRQGTRPGPLAAAVAASTALLLLHLALSAGPAIERHKVWTHFGRTLAALPKDTEIRRCGEIEASLVFYADHGIIPNAGYPADALNWLRSADGAGVLVVLGQQFAEMQRLAGDAGIPGRELVRMSGYNYSNGKMVTLIAWDNRPAP